MASLAKVTKDRELALTALVVRAIERERSRVSPSDALALEQRIVRVRFGGTSRRIEPRWRRRARAWRLRAASSATSCVRATSLPGCRRGGCRRVTSRGSARRSRRCSPASSSSRPRRAGSRRGEALRWRRPLRTSCSAFRRDGARRYAQWRASSRSRPSRTHGTRCATRRVCSTCDRARASGRAALRRLCRVVAPTAALGREQARLRAGPASRARRRRHLLVRAVPLARRARGGALARRAEIAAGPRRAFGSDPVLGHVATRPLRGRDHHVAARALRKPERGIGTHDECGRVVLRKQLGDASREGDDADLRKRALL